MISLSQFPGRLLMKDFFHRIFYPIIQLEDIRPVAALLAVLTLFIAVNTQNPLNNDGILYLQAAEAFAKSGWKAAMQIYRWPFYSVLIVWLGKLTNLSFEHAAYVLNAALLVIIVTTFITLVKELGGSRTVQLFGAILIISHPRLHHYQNYIIRGFGYWGFSLLSLLYLIRYYRQLLWRHAIGWGIFINIATLFRPEGAVLCCLTPLVLLLRANSGLWSRIGCMLKPYAINILMAIILFVLWFSMPDSSSVHLGRLSEILNQFQNGLTLLINNLDSKAVLISQIVFNAPSEKWGLTMIISGLIGLCFYRLVTTLGPLQTLLCGHAISKKLMPKDDGAKRVLVYFTLLNLLIPAIHIGQTFEVFSHRFFMLASLLLLLWPPFSLHRFFQQWRDRKKVLTGNSLLFFSVSLVFIIMFVYVFIPAKPTKAYVVSAGTWLKQNMPQQASLYSNTEQIPFYAQRQLILWDAFDDTPLPKLKPNDFIALRVKRKNQAKFAELLTQLKFKTVKVFANKRGDRVVILQVSEINS